MKGLSKTFRLAVDIGASGGRVYLGDYDGAQLHVREVHRFLNVPVFVHGTLYWDLLHLYQETLTGITLGQKIAAQIGGSVGTVGIDTWAVDFGILDASGSLLGNPVHYRDLRTLGAVESVTVRVPKWELYQLTGIQFQPFNTLYQLNAMLRRGHPHFQAAKSLLLIPDLFNYFLTGQRAAEYTNATTTQLLDIRTKNWSERLLEALGISRTLFAPIVFPGTHLGQILPEVSELVGAKATVCAVASHDTASAVVSIPTRQENFAYISCGTWSLMGVERSRPIVSNRSMQWNFTNEGGVDGTYRFLKNITGLWILQEMKREWEEPEIRLDWPEMESWISETHPFEHFIDVNDPSFSVVGNMSNRIYQFCKRTEQRIPETRAALVRCVLESLALTYRVVLEQIEELTNSVPLVIHIVGGGSKSKVLCQWTANACKRPVIAGPADATAVGNLLVQYISSGELSGIREARHVVARSAKLSVFEPENTEVWDTAYARYSALCGRR